MSKNYYYTAQRPLRYFKFYNELLKEELCQMSIGQINVLSIDEIKKQMQTLPESRRKSFIFKHRHKDGTISDVEVFSSKVNIAGKQYHHSIIMDITDKMVIENALKLSEEKFSKAFRSSPDLIMITEFDTGQIVDVNDRVTEQTGYSYEEVIGRTTLELEYWYNPADREKFVQLLNEQGKVHNMEALLKLKSGELRLNLISAEVFELQGKKFILGVNRDISEISKFNKMLQEKNKELESYVYITSHDLRSPLVNIQGFSSRLKKQTEKIQHILKDSMSDDEREKLLNEQLNEKIPLSLDYIFTNVVKMDRMLNGLLQISRTGRLPMQIQKMDMDMLIRNIIKSLNHEISKKNANIEVEKLPDCFGDDNLLNQLFSNIIGNALKYSKENIQPLIHISGKHLKNKSLYCITDNGIGIPETQIAKIWNMFFRVDYKSYSGEGIGLSVVKRIVEKHKGQIWVESKECEGTNFFIELPNHVFSE